jgi:hypothetical protein
MEMLRSIRVSFTTISRLVGLLAALVLPLALSRGAEPDRPSRETPKMRLWVPAYFYPAGEGLEEWDRLMKSGRQVPIVAVVNPASGPGEKVDPNYVAVTDRARKAGLPLVGYVSTQYGKRSLDAVKADVDNWVRFYPKIQGFHVDEQSSEAARVDYYAALYQYVRRKIPDALVLSNPGTECASAYLSRPAADAICLFERDKGFEDFHPPAWAKPFPPSRFGVIAYDVKTADKMREHVRAAERHGIGHVYVTDARGANPYNRLPTYWDDEVRAIRQINKANSAPRKAD